MMILQPKLGSHQLTIMFILAFLHLFKTCDEFLNFMYSVTVWHNHTSSDVKQSWLLLLFRNIVTQFSPTKYHLLLSPNAGSLRCLKKHRKCFQTSTTTVPQGCSPLSVFRSAAIYLVSEGTLKWFLIWAQH